MFKINKLSKKVIVYSTSLVLITTLIFTVISMSTLIMFKKYAVSKTQATFKDNADRNLEREVVFYAKILNKAMEARQKTVYMFGKILDKDMETYNKCNRNNEITNIYEEMNQSFDMRAIEILDSDLNVRCKFPQYIDTSIIPKLLEKMANPASYSSSRVQYMDFHINGDKSASFSYVYLTKDINQDPIYIVFDFNPYSIYSLIKTAQLYPYSQKYLWVVNKNGVLIYDPPAKGHPLITLSDNVDLTKASNGALLSVIVKNKILKGGTGIARYIFRDVDKFVGYTYIKKLGWGLGLTLPTATFYAPIAKLSRDIDIKTIHTLSILSIINALVILLSVVAAMFASKKITQPITQTIEAIDAIIKGNRAARLPEEGDDELKELASSVNKLMDFFDRILSNVEKNKEEPDGR